MYFGGVWLSRRCVLSGPSRVWTSVILLHQCHQDLTDYKISCRLAKPYASEMKKYNHVTRFNFSFWNVKTGVITPCGHDRPFLRRIQCWLLIYIKEKKNESQYIRFTLVASETQLRQFVFRQSGTRLDWGKILNSHAPLDCRYGKTKMSFGGTKPEPV